MTNTSGVVIGARHHELSLDGAIPRGVIELYPNLGRLAGRNAAYYAAQLWDRIKSDADSNDRHRGKADAQMVLNNVMGELFGTFLVLLPGGETPTEGIRIALESASIQGDWSKDPRMPKEHAILIEGKDAITAKDSFFDALFAALREWGVTRDEYQLRLASTLIAVFFRTHAKKMQRLALAAAGIVN